MKNLKSQYRRAVLPAAAVLVGGTMLCGIFWTSGVNPLTVLWLFFTGGGTSYGVADALSKTLSICLCAFAVALPGKLGLVNIGGEGQLIAGAIGAASMVYFLPFPSSPLLLLGMGLSAALAGALWAGIPGLLKATTGADEIVVSLLANYLAAFLLLYLINGPLRDPASLGWPQSPLLPLEARMAGLGATRISPFLLITPFLALGLAWFFSKTKAGFRSRIVGSGLGFRRYLAIPAPKYILSSMLWAGVLAGLAGMIEISMVHGRLREGISHGYGYAGFFVAWLCGNRFLLCIPVAFVFALFASGADALQLEAGIPYSSLFVFQGVLFLTVLALAGIRGRSRP